MSVAGKLANALGRNDVKRKSSGQLDARLRRRGKDLRVAFGRRWALAALLVFFSTVDGFAAIGKLGTERNLELAELYVASAVVALKQFPGLAFAPGYVAKRDGSHVVNVVPAMEDADFDPKVITALKAIGADLQKHSSGVSINVVDEQTIVQFMQFAQSVPDHNLPNTIIVLVGQRASIDRAIQKAAIKSPAILNPYQDERSRGEPICLALVAPKSAAIETAAERQTIGMVSVYVESGAEIEPCLYRSLMASFGLGGQIGPATASMFSNPVKYESPTPLDWDLWRIHTDPRIRAGMSIDEALIAAKEIISSWN